MRSTGMSPKATNVSGSSRLMPPAAAKIRTPPPKPSSSVDDDDYDENAPVPEGLVRCSICKRNFAEERIEKHQVICQKTKSKKRRIYDASKKRVQVS